MLIKLALDETKGNMNGGYPHYLESWQNTPSGFPLSANLMAVNHEDKFCLHIWSQYKAAAAIQDLTVLHFPI